MNPFSLHLDRGAIRLEWPATLALDLPPLTLVFADEGDDLDDEDRAALHAAIDRSIEQLERGESVPAEEVLRKLELWSGFRRDRRRPLPDPAAVEARFGPTLLALAGGETIHVYEGRSALLEPEEDVADMEPRPMVLCDESDTLTAEALAEVSVMVLRTFSMAGGH